MAKRALLCRQARVELVHIALPDADGLLDVCKPAFQPLCLLSGCRTVAYDMHPARTVEMCCVLERRHSSSRRLQPTVEEDCVRAQWR